MRVLPFALLAIMFAAASRAFPTSLRNIVREVRSTSVIRMVHIEKKLEELGIELPPAPTPKVSRSNMPDFHRSCSSL